MSRRLEDAIVYFEKAYELNRNDPMLYYHYSAVLLKKKLRKSNQNMQGRDVKLP